MAGKISRRNRKKRKKGHRDTNNVPVRVDQRSSQTLRYVRKRKKNLGVRKIIRIVGGRG